MTNVSRVSTIEEELHDGRLIDVTDIAHRVRLKWRRAFMTRGLLYGDPLRGNMQDVRMLLLDPKGVSRAVDSNYLGRIHVLAVTGGKYLRIPMYTKAVRRADGIFVFMASELDDDIDYEKLVPEDGELPFTVN